ncbi:lactosylceramide 4-alpha-galactosyltransferase-like [Contarinia nasturtii]|uniref:lactosylceramide 4-alpha-galactosyltransferase-like n=1 Tax=Contarinia nasturtii TaxID=265458 RepID=UPI0012D4C1EC|nr:lactosylceramide 4-alpha-galactosyltransferase-like [Contarinia nasturtii]
MNHSVKVLRYAVSSFRKILIVPIIITILLVTLLHKKDDIYVILSSNKYFNVQNDSKVIPNESQRKIEPKEIQPKLISIEFRYLNYTKAQVEKIKRDKKCYELEKPVENVQFIDDIEISPPKPDTSIFFIATSCMNDGQFTLNARETCAIESAATQNPNRDVYVLFVSPVGFTPNKSNSSLIGILKSFRNVHFRNLNIYDFSKNTPAEQWVTRDQIFLSPYFKTQMSDYIRFLTLYKFGGIYFDMDFIMIKSVDELPPNFMPLEKSDKINASVLGFASNGTGHNIMDMILRECIEKYDPNSWSHNGPGALRRVAQRICKAEYPKMIKRMLPEFCEGLKIMPQVEFFPLNPDEHINKDPQIVKQALKKVTDQTVAIHLWSSLTREIDILKSEPDSFYTIMSKKFCPKSFGASGLHFN